MFLILAGVCTTWVLSGCWWWWLWWWWWRWW